jgi:hypothetical protein
MLPAGSVFLAAAEVADEWVRLTIESLTARELLVWSGGDDERTGEPPVTEREAQVSRRRQARGFLRLLAAIVRDSNDAVIVQDAFDAMSSDLPYRKALSLDETVRRLSDGAGAQWPSGAPSLRRCSSTWSSQRVLDPRRTR